MEQTNPTPQSGEDKTVAILSYITLIGFIIALVMHSNNKTKLGAYHLRQSLGLVITVFALWIVITILAFIPFIGIMIGLVVAPVIWIGFLVLWIFGLINAVNGVEKPVPLIGEMYAKMLSGAFA